MNPAQIRLSLSFAVLIMACLGCRSRSVLQPATEARRPNVLVIVADQWRFEAFGYAGNPDVKTPHLDALAKQSVHCVNAISGVPVCSPMRASFLTGQRPLTHGVFLNDVPLNPQAETLSKVFARAGYDTGFIGKWHLNGDGRSAFIPRERRQGFDYWKALECTHNYNRSRFYADSPELQQWEGYDAIAQTRDAQDYLRRQAQSKRPFFLVLAWGPPHDPYLTAPAEYRAMYSPETLRLRPNVPDTAPADLRQNLAGYYAHCSALDACVGDLRRTLAETGLDQNTLIVFTSDHGDMLGSHGLSKKQKPYDESIRVPVLFHWPAALDPREVKTPVNSEDLMPTILGLCGLPIPGSVEGYNLSPHLRGKKGSEPAPDSTVIACIAPFGEWGWGRGGKEYRGLRTERYTYVRDLKGPWLLFDNDKDPFQTQNLVNLPQHLALQKHLDLLLTRKLKAQKDAFLPASHYIAQWKYTVDSFGTVPYAP